jgi:hypothetical protein
MSTNRPSFEKRERDRQKKAKAAAKRDKRLAGRATDAEEEGEVEAPAPAVDESAILARLEDLHKRFDDEQISFDDFEEQRAALLEQLAI